MVTPQNQIEEDFEQIWQQVAHVVNRVLGQSKIYGFEMMHLANPTVEQLVTSLDEVIIPLLDRLVREEKLSAFSSIKVVNIRQYTLRLREMEIALRDDDPVRFAAARDQLDKEAQVI